MATNITVFAVDGPVVIYFQDGSTTTVEVQAEYQFQLPEAEMCTISDTPPKEESAESPPPGYAFAKAMVEFWQLAVAQFEQAEVNPL